jgi:group I intron endonuclease
MASDINAIVVGETWRAVGMVAKASGVYAIVNTMNGKRYIGSAENLRRRRTAHRSALSKNKHANKHLQAAWNKYGESAFVFVVLEYVHPIFLLDIEQKHLDSNRGGYNIAKHAEATSKGLTRSAETRAKLSAIHKGKTISPEQRQKLSEAGKGRVVTKETRAKQSASNRGQKRSPETVARISAALKGRTLSPEHCEKMAAASRGRKHSDETRARISAALTGRKLSAEHCEKIGALRRGTKLSDEQRAKLSAAHRRRLSMIQEGV